MAGKPYFRSYQIDDPQFEDFLLEDLVRCSTLCYL